MNYVYEHCQSCGMPLSKDTRGGGTNVDGSISHMYCSHCFTNGQFQNLEIDTPEKMKTFVVSHLQERGFPLFMAKFFTRNIATLARWTIVPESSSAQSLSDGASVLN